MRHARMVEIEIKIGYIDPHPREEYEVEEAYVVWGETSDIHEGRKFTTDQGRWTELFLTLFGIKACIDPKGILLCLKL